MPSLAIQADNTTSFDIAVEGYQGSMSTPNMINLVSGKRISAAVPACPADAPPNSASTAPANRP
jgi:hypothetical protein